MKKTILASACVLILSAGGAIAQAQPAPGASGSVNVGPGPSGPITRVIIHGAPPYMGISAPAGRWVIWNGIRFGPSVRGVPGHICDEADNGKIC